MVDGFAGRLSVGFAGGCVAGLPNDGRPGFPGAAGFGFRAWFGRGIVPIRAASPLGAGARGGCRVDRRAGFLTRHRP